MKKLFGLLALFVEIYPMHGSAQTLCHCDTTSVGIIINDTSKARTTSWTEFLSGKAKNYFHSTAGDRFPDGLRTYKERYLRLSDDSLIAIEYHCSASPLPKKTSYYVQVFDGKAKKAYNPFYRIDENGNIMTLVFDESKGNEGIGYGLVGDHPLPTAADSLKVAYYLQRFKE